MKNYIDEFLPWDRWVKLPQNQGLDLTEAMKRYNFERNEYLQRIMYYELNNPPKEDDK